MAIDPDDEFFGDQSSESDNSCPDECSGAKGIRGDALTGLSNHEYRSREASVRTLSYLDGYDETKEEKLQEGFSRGYRQSFWDAMAIGRRLGSLCASAAMDESLTLGLHVVKSDASAAVGSDGCTSPNRIERPAGLVRQFLTDEILMGSKDDAEKKYEDALSRLKEELERIST